MVFMDLENIRKHNIQPMCAANLSFQLAQKNLKVGPAITTARSVILLSGQFNSLPVLTAKLNLADKLKP